MNRRADLISQWIARRSLALSLRWIKLTSALLWKLQGTRSLRSKKLATFRRFRAICPEVSETEFHEKYRAFRKDAALTRKCIQALVAHFQVSEFDLDERFIEWRNKETLLRAVDSEKPLIVVGWHVGCFIAINSALKSLGLPVTKVVLNDKFETWPENWEVIIWDPQNKQGAMILKKALNVLRSGETVFIMPDPGAYHPSTRPMAVGPWLIPMTPSFATLAHLADAEVLPISGRWNKTYTKIILEVEEPLHADLPSNLPEDEVEGALIEAYKKRVSRWIAAHPEHIQFQRVRRLDGEIREALKSQNSKDIQPGNESAVA